MVTIHELGTRRVSVRTVPSHVTKNYLPLFETVNRKAALIGLPLAVVRTRKEWKVVMHWKPHRHSMRDYVRDAPLPNVRKALWSAATQLGKLHGAGFIHGHAQVIGNLVVNDRMNTQLVDPKFLYESTARAEQYAEYRIFIQDIHHPLQRRMNPGQFLKLRRLLRHQYNRAFERARKPASSE
ncbi:hypothetical protein KJ765_00625 [Candidatus Micrarchaeota archaeon]|nr:hypothetical protein [Candidatus Micrarchaeota archaeon]